MSTSSWGWRNILPERDINLKGWLWVVGNGKGIHIWEDSWNCSLPEGKLQSRPLELVNISGVNDIIDSSATC